MCKRVSCPKHRRDLLFPRRRVKPLPVPKRAEAPLARHDQGGLPPLDLAAAGIFAQRFGNTRRT
jgi:energy-converting hydrogenase Eha subunit F